MDFSIHIGWDPRDDLAAKVCASSLGRHWKIGTPKNISFIKEHELRKRGMYEREYTKKFNGQMVDNGDFKPFSTEFSFTRFLTPYLSPTKHSIFVDADFLFRADINELMASIDPDKTVSVVMHDYKPTETIKMDGVIQSPYPRKNWSSLMVFNNELARQSIKVEDVTQKTGSWLHQFKWLHNDEIGGINEEWNWLEGWSASSSLEPKAVHYTRGTPDMIGNGLPYAHEWIEYANAL